MPIIDWGELRIRSKQALKRAAEVIEPVARIAADAGAVLAHIERPTPIGIVTAVATGIVTANEWVRDTTDDDTVPSISIEDGDRGLRAMYITALDRMAPGHDDDGTRVWDIADVGEDDTGPGILIVGDVSDGLHAVVPDLVYRHPERAPTRDELMSIVERIREQVRVHSPLRVDVALDSAEPELSSARETAIHGIASPRGADVLAATVPMLRSVSSDGPGRCILLDGPPGTGKTVMAHWIADQVSGPGARVMTLRYDLSPEMGEDDVRSACRVWRPDTVIVDDVDKLETDLENSVIEQLRASARLVILTANNGTEVIDGSLLRPGRVDEVFTIDTIGIDLVAPDWAQELDAVAPGTWDRIRCWPVATLTEVRARFAARGVDALGIDELESRIGMDVWSGGRLFQVRAMRAAADDTVTRSDRYDDDQEFDDELDEPEEQVPEPTKKKRSTRPKARAKD